MIKRIYIENFALVEKLEINFEDGMNVLTGETGAGKSIIVGALACLLGERAGKDDIRTGAKLAAIEAEFTVSGIPKIENKLIELEIDCDDSVINLRREVPLTRSSKCFINNRLVTLAQLKSITDDLAELFGQHSHQLLLDERNHPAFLDRFARLDEKVNILRQIYHNWDSTKKELANLQSRIEIEKNERELLLFQKEEIEKAKISSGEEEQLIAEKKILDSSQILGEKSSLILYLLEQNENSALEILNSCQKELTGITNLDERLVKKAELLDQAIINLEEFRGEIEAYLSDIPDNPERLEEINLRLDEIYRLKKKYGGSEESILSTLEKIYEQLKLKINVDERISILENEENRLFEKYKTLALEISAVRKKASAELEKMVIKELKNLGIDSAAFEYEFIYEDDTDGIKLENRIVRMGPDGLESGRFLISANPGEPLKPLAQTASGGEISRIMLALKASDRKKSKKYKPLLVFDEIDSGIGGETANIVAERLKRLSDDYQLLVITHLHQIAALGDNHYAVAKIDTKSKRKIISVRQLDKAEKKTEIKRMLSLPQEIEIT
jgi:DNA repair protein RecN (Recombination protein N)